MSRCLCPAQTLSMIYQITFWLLGPSFKELHALVPNYLFRLTSHDCSTFPISSSEIEEPLLPGSSATGSPIERHHGPSRASTEYFLLSITASVYLLLRNTYVSVITLSHTASLKNHVSSPTLYLFFNIFLNCHRSFASPYKF